MPSGRREAVQLSLGAAHCCVGAALVGAEDGTADGGRVGAAVLGLRVRTSAGSRVPYEYPLSTPWTWGGHRVHGVSPSTLVLHTMCLRGLTR
jgi:hypothetical protein